MQQKSWNYVCLALLPLILWMAPGLIRAQAVSTKDYSNFAELLKTYQLYPEFVPLLEKTDKELLEKFKKLDLGTLKTLPAASFTNLYRRFYTDYVGFKETKEKIQKNIKALEEKKIALPLSQKKSIVDLDLKIQASSDGVKQAKFVLFNTSFKANRAFMEMLASPSVNAAMKASAPAATPSRIGSAPKLPGSLQGSKLDRTAASEAEKLNLTPVDPEFYSTQLGKKLEKDLGGKADYWSYDYDQDELYVSVGKDVGKLRVKQRDQGTRIIQTRIGSDFNDFPSNYSGDEQVNLNTANGRFLTGNLADPTLFGAFPNKQPSPGISEEPGDHRRVKPSSDH